MRRRLRVSALVLAGAMSFAASARPAAAVVEKDPAFGYCKIACGAATAGCVGVLGDAEFCAGVATGCIYGCGA
jgi:hypothetical protein